MSFITKRERVFNEYDLYDLPSRNEGKLKAYASCTDARAWSHFGSDKTEHLVEIIKRNNETCRTKYVPTDVIVNTLMGAKNAEISRLKRKIEEFEQMIAAYDQLELTCDQKCEIANAHAAIKAANKELDEMCLELDLSGFTEGIDSEAFETGKSRGDELTRSIGDETAKSKGDEIEKSRTENWKPTKPQTARHVSKSSQVEPEILSCPCDASTSASDTRIDDMQDVIIRKDAKLNAMQNIMAVMENDLREPYCIYADINTALEKIFGTLCQNGKYKQYLNLLTAGKDTRCIDIKGKILFKMKVLEKFCLALVAPCSQDFHENKSEQDCSCYRAEIVANLASTLAITSGEANANNMDDRRAQLVADIIDNEEMKEILSKDSIVIKNDIEQRDENYGFDSCSVDTENLNRLKNLQTNYEELLTCYDNLKYEKDCLFLRCQKFNDLEKECECMQSRLREYKHLWSEKEYYKKRSEDLDTLKESYFILSDETSNLESKLKAELEINKIKTNNIARLQYENVNLEKKLQDLSVVFEKEKNSLLCKLQEYECTIMCQDQQIKTLSQQIDKFLEQGHDDIHSEDAKKSMELLNEIESQKEQIKNLREALLCNEEEKQVLRDDFEVKLELINELKIELENLKDKSDKLLQTNNCLEEYTRDYQKQIRKLQEQNRILVHEIETKQHTLEHLKDTINSKSDEINSLANIIETKSCENIKLLQELNNSQEMYSKTLTTMNNENDIAIDSLKSAQRESYEVLENFRIYIQENDPTKVEALSPDQSLKPKDEHVNEGSSNASSSILLHEIKKFHDISLQSLQSLLDENIRYKDTIDISKKESVILEEKINKLEELNIKFTDLKNTYEKVLDEKNKLQNELELKKRELDDLIHSFQLTKKESNELLERLNHTENIKEEFMKLNAVYQKLVNERDVLKNELEAKDQELQNITIALNKYEKENEKILLENQRLQNFENELEQLKQAFDEKTKEKNYLQEVLKTKTDEMNNLYNKLELKIEENRQLINKIDQLHERESSTQVNLSKLMDEKLNIQNDLLVMKKDSASIIDKLESELKHLKDAYTEVQLEKQKLHKDYDLINKQLEEFQKDQTILQSQNQELKEHSEELEKTLQETQALLHEQSGAPKDFLDSIKQEIETMKKEKILHRKNIRDLTDKLDESDIIICHLKEEISSGDNKIATLQNYINELEEEVRRLNNNIAVAVESSEQIVDSSHKKIDESLRILDAHHSKATHNMKLELTKLKKEYSLLENQLSNTKCQTEEITKEKHKFISEIRDLQDERDVILQNIKDLETLCTGDSSLTVNQCTINEILTSINKIRKCIEAKSSKSSSLEQTLLTVQNSSRLLLSKADEAKRIAENEKQKIITEKEEAIKERLTLEKELAVLEIKLEQQIAKDQEIIKNLEGKLLNQKLIFEKINESSQIYVNNLETEILNLQDLYNNSLSKVSELQERAVSVSEENNKKLLEIENVTKNLERKSKEITYLRKCIEDIKNKPTKTTNTQTIEILDLEDKSCQTEFVKLNDNGEVNSFAISEENTDVVNGNNKNMSLSFDFMKQVYINYKIKKLSATVLEHCSISCTNIEDSTNNNESLSELELPDENISDKLKNTNNFTNHHKIIDIYNTHSIFTHNTELSSKSLGIESMPELTSETFANAKFDENDPKIENRIKVNEEVDQPIENDLFLIYKDSDVNHSDFDKNMSWPNQIQSKVISESATTKVDKKNLNKETAYKNEEPKKYDSYSNQDDDSVKQKLTLSLPRVYTDSVSKVDTYEKSLDSYPKDTFSDVDMNTTEKIKTKKVTDSGMYILLTENKDMKDLTAVTNQSSSKKRRHRKNEGLQNDEQKHLTLKGQDRYLLNEPKKMTFLNEDTISDVKNDTSTSTEIRKELRKRSSNYGLKYILDSVQPDININSFNMKTNTFRRTVSDNNLSLNKDYISEQGDSRSLSPISRSLADYKTASSKDVSKTSKNGQSSFSIEQGCLAKLDDIQEYENKIKELTSALYNTEKHYKTKIEAVKAQYDNNIKSIINEHNQGVASIQSLHEETLTDVIRSHESEVENLRSMSIEAMRKVEILEKENRIYKLKLLEHQPNVSSEEPMKIPSPELRKRKHRRSDTKILTKTNIEAFNVRPKPRSHGPCTCTLDANISDTIRNIFEQVDVDQRRMAEHAYLKYIANKIINNNVEALDAQELAFLHHKVCRTWKTMLSKEEALQKRIDSLESELMNKQRQTQKHIAELDRKVAEERQRLQEVREAVCRNTPPNSRDISPQTHTVPEKDVCKCCSTSCNFLDERLSAGDLPLGLAASTLRPRRVKQESNRAVSAKMGGEERKNKKPYQDEQPIRLRRSRDRANKPGNKK